MHETVVAESVLRTILEHAEKLKAKPVRAVISCGQFNALNDEIMQVAFDTAAGGTLCQGMKLTIKHIPLQAVCGVCGRKFDFDVYHPQCVQCQSADIQIQPDAPLLLEEIEFEEPK
jgi:hydrogenase nickel insertion protein HypA